MREKRPDLDITPETRVSELLEAYPYLEAVLIEMAPPFAKLRNPILRRTVARVTTLHQAARVGGVPLGELINRLRREAGLEEQAVAASAAGDEEQPAPDWADERHVVATLDARPLIERGDHPMQLIISNLKRLEPGQVFTLVTPFVPAPIIDHARSLGFESWTKKVDANTYTTFFRRHQMEK